MGATEVALLIASFSGDAVVRMSHVTAEGELRKGRNERAEVLPLRGTAFERVLCAQERIVTPTGSGWDVLVPVTERGDAIGILELELHDDPVEEVLDYLDAAAHALAYVLIASRRHTDLFEWAQRDTPFSLAAEIQRRLLPSSYSVESASFTLAGWLEPSSTVGGDTFDYSMDREHLYLSITDAMGHSTHAALLATLTVGSLRNSRRALASPGEQARAANDALLRDTRPDQFVTGLVLRIGLADGLLEVVNAGHHPPFLLRAGAVSVLDLPPDLVLGVADADYLVHRFPLEAGDRLLFITDGFLERNAADVDVAGALAASRALHPREMVGRLSRRVIEAAGGALTDDAAALCLDWYGPGGRREATSGASRARATPTS